MNFSDITYVDGFSGSWETQTEDYSDSSFLIALNVLKDAQAQMAARGKRRRIRCFFSETDAAAYTQLRDLSGGYAPKTGNTWKQFTPRAPPCLSVPS